MISLMVIGRLVAVVGLTLAQEKQPDTTIRLSTGATIGGGSGAPALQNQNGVIINLAGTAQRLKFKLSVDGVKMTLKGS